MHQNAILTSMIIFIFRCVYIFKLQYCLSGLPLWPKPTVKWAWSSNQRKETARHEYFFALLLLETVVGAKASLVAGFLVPAKISA